jgi:CNT family concentrative nucleoside transporter
MNDSLPRRALHRALIAIGLATRSLPWLVVAFCLLLIAVGSSIQQSRGDLGLVDLGQPLYAQTDSGPDAAPDAAPMVESDKSDAAAPAPGDAGAVVPPATGDAKANADADANPKKPAAALAPPPKKKTVLLKEMSSDEAWGSRAISFLGLFAFIGIAWLMSNNRRKVNWKLVAVGCALQLGFAVMIFWMPGGKEFFEICNAVFNKLIGFTQDGANFLFNSWVTDKREIGNINFAFIVLPTIIFFSSLMTILYHIGIMQYVVKGFAWLMQRAMGTSGAESLSAAANIFVGQTEAPLVVKPFIDKMTMSELMTVMTGGFATVAGGVLAAYVGMLNQYFPDIAGHLIAASVLSAPAALVIGKIMYPETGQPETMGSLKMSIEKPDANVIEAAARGAGEGLTLALNVGAMLLAFIAIIYGLNYLLALPSHLYNGWQLNTLLDYFAANSLAIPEACGLVKENGDIVRIASEEAILGCIATMNEVKGVPQVGHLGILTFQTLLGWIFSVVAWIMGVPWEDCFEIGQLLGIKMVLNEFVAYKQLGDLLKNGTQLNQRSVIIATYALCGFANFSSIAIQIGGLGGIAPDRRSDLAKLGLRAMIAGTIAAFMTATIAGILI